MPQNIDWLTKCGHWTCLMLSKKKLYFHGFVCITIGFTPVLRGLVLVPVENLGLDFDNEGIADIEEDDLIELAVEGLSKFKLLLIDEPLEPVLDGLTIFLICGLPVLRLLPLEFRLLLPVEPIKD